MSPLQQRLLNLIARQPCDAAADLIASYSNTDSVPRWVMFPGKDLSKLEDIWFRFILTLDDWSESGDAHRGDIDRLWAQLFERLECSAGGDLKSVEKCYEKTVSSYRAEQVHADWYQPYFVDADFALNQYLSMKAFYGLEWLHVSICKQVYAVDLHEQILGSRLSQLCVEAAILINDRASYEKERDTPYASSNAIGILREFGISFEDCFGMLDRSIGRRITEIEGIYSGFLENGVISSERDEFTGYCISLLQMPLMCYTYSKASVRYGTTHS